MQVFGFYPLNWRRHPVWLTFLVPLVFLSVSTRTFVLPTHAILSYNMLSIWSSPGLVMARQPNSTKPGNSQGHTWLSLLGLQCKMAPLHTLRASWHGSHALTGQSWWEPKAFVSVNVIHLGLVIQLDFGFLIPHCIHLRSFGECRLLDL